MDSVLHIDIETYSDVDLLKMGVYRYSASPTFRILMAAWSLDGSPVEVAIGEDEVRAIPGLWDPTVRKVAHNAQFERVCFSRFAGMAEGDYLDPAEWDDTMIRAAQYGYPLSLDALAKELGGELKDTAGTRLINLFCKPNRKGERVLPEERPEEWEAFVEYCRQDVVTLIDVDAALPPLPTALEENVWLADQAINDRGMRIDVDLARAAFDAAEDNRMVQEVMVSAKTGIVNPSSRNQLLEWLQGDGVAVADLRAETVEQLLLRDDLTPLQREVLEMRQELALSSSAKYATALGAVCSDGRIRGGFRFYGAHTGRWAGRGVQPHNLPREALPPDETLEVIDRLKLTGEATPYELKCLVRPMFVGPFIVADFSAIEARVLAWLAGEEWALDAFRSGRDIYVETATRMSTPNRPLTRFQGKVAVLALGYGGAQNSLRSMGAEGDDRELRLLVDQWRYANERITTFWRLMGEAFRSGGPVGKFITVEVDGKDRALRLPSGRALHFRDCEWRMEETQFGPRVQASFRNPRRGGVRTRTYGGRLTENVTQAVARDVLAEALVSLEALGVNTVGHVHDEILVEDEIPMDDFISTITATPSWAPGLPLAGEGFTDERYRKD